MNRVVIHDHRRVFDGFFKIDEALVSYEGAAGGMIGPVRRLSLERGDAAAAVVFHRDRRALLMARQFRYPTHARGPGWLDEILAGMVDAGERPDEAIRREVREESGYDIEQLDDIGTFYLSPGGSSERVVLYYAEVSDASRVGPGGGQIGEGEDIQIVETPVADLVRDALAGRVADAKTLVGILWLVAARPDLAGR
jgi:ADP-ribose pyrophosphatase